MNSKFLKSLGLALALCLAGASYSAHGTNHGQRFKTQIHLHE